MSPEHLRFPVYVLVGMNQRDAAARSVAISDGMEVPHAVVGDIRCMPIFTHLGTAREFARNNPCKGGSYLSRFNGRKLLEMLEAVKPPGIVIDPRQSDSPEVENDALDTGIVIAWLRGQAERGII